MPYTDDEKKMAKRGYCYLKNSESARGLKKLVRNPENYRRNELEFDRPAFETHKNKKRN